MIFAFIGPRGAGKSTITKRLADLAGWPSLSTDELVVRSAGKPIAQIVAEEDWAGFRAREKKALAACLQECERIVKPGEGVFLDAGGGLILDPENRATLRAAAQIVYLHANPDVLAVRVRSADEQRPALTDMGDAAAEMKRTFAERDPIYLELADLEIDTDDMGVEGTVTILLSWVMARCGVCQF